MAEEAERGISQRRNTWNPGAGFASAGIIAILSITSATAIYPDYSTRNQAISYLGGAGVRTELFWDISVLLAGVLWLIGTYFLYRDSRRIALAVFLCLAGVGFILVGFSPWNVFPATHYIGANMIFLFGALGSLTSSRFTKGPFSAISVIAGLLSVAAYASGYFGGDYILGPGGIERMIYYPVLLWSIGFGGYLMNTHQIVHVHDGS